MVIKLRPQTTSEASRETPWRIHLTYSPFSVSLYSSSSSSSSLFLVRPRIYHNLRCLTNLLVSNDQFFTDFIQLSTKPEVLIRNAYFIVHGCPLELHFSNVRRVPVQLRTVH